MRIPLPVRLPIAALALITGSALIACDPSLSDRIIAIEDSGSVRLFVFIDTNLNGQYNPGQDSLARNQLVSLRMKGAAQDARTARPDRVGFAAFSVPAGRYRPIVSTTVLGDSLVVMNGGDEFTVAANDTIQVGVTISFSILNVTTARTAPTNRRFWLTGIAANTPGAFGDSTLHVMDPTSGIRSVRVRPAPILPGDSVLLFGSRTSRDGQPAFDVQTFLIRAQLNPPAPDTLSTAVAATADAGRRDARLVLIRSAVIGDTATMANGSRLLRVDDGTGTVGVVLSSSLNFTPLSQYAIGTRLDVMGLLVPDPTNFTRWQIKPRGRVDLVINP